MILPGSLRAMPAVFAPKSTAMTLPILLFYLPFLLISEKHAVFLHAE
jgi:hypothetical protein